MRFVQPKQQRSLSVTRGKALGEQIELPPARFDDAVWTRDETSKLLHPGQQRRSEIGLQVLIEFHQLVQRAFEW